MVISPGQLLARGGDDIEGGAAAEFGEDAQARAAETQE
jgi:hypothetical protein